VVSGRGELGGEAGADAAGAQDSDAGHEVMLLAVSDRRSEEIGQESGKENG
jgi:hypothetical protein